MSSSHQSKFPCIIITIIIILLFVSSFSTLLTVNLFVLFWRCFVMLNSYFVCFIIYIFFFSILKFFLLILFSFQKSGFVSAFIRSASYSNMRLSLIFAGLIFANMRLANLVPTSRRCLVTWFCYQLIAKLGNKTATVSWPDPYRNGSSILGQYTQEITSILW